MGAEGGWRRELSVQSLGRARGGRCSVPRPKVRRMGHTERVCKVCGPWPAGKSCRPGLFFPLSSRTSFNHRHSVHPPPVPVSQLRLPDDTVSMTLVASISLFRNTKMVSRWKCLWPRRASRTALEEQPGWQISLLMVVPCQSLRAGWLHLPREPCCIARLPAVGGTSCPEIWE